MWTDGSENRQTNFADNSELAGGQCCVKAGARGWRGASCSSLLYGVCQYQVDLASLLASPTFSLTPRHRGLRLAWSCSLCQGWQPSSLSITLCLHQRLADRTASIEEDCREVTSEDEQSRDILGLQPFAEYKLEVTAFLEFFNLTTRTTLFGRTCKLLCILLTILFTKSLSVPDTSVEWSVSTEGHLHLVWRERISHFADDNFVELTWLTDSHGEGLERGLVSGVSLDHLVLGADYLATLTDLITNTTTSFNFTACELFEYLSLVSCLI